MSLIHVNDKRCDDIVYFSQHDVRQMFEENMKLLATIDELKQQIRERDQWAQLRVQYLVSRETRYQAQMRDIWKLKCEIAKLKVQRDFFYVLQ